MRDPGPSVSAQAPAPAVYVAGRGLLSSLGWGCEAALAALQKPPPVLPRVPLALFAESAPEATAQCWPLHTLPPLAGNWQARLAEAVRAVVAQTGVTPQSEMPLFLASSSLDIGYEEELERAEGASFLGGMNSFSRSVRQALNWAGPVFCFSTACTSSLQALVAARDWLRAGEATDALVLGVEMDNLFTPAGFAALQLLAPQEARPFAAARDGLVLGQAVAALHLSTTPTRWCLGGAVHRLDGSQPTGAVPTLLTEVAAQALAQAGCTPQALTLIKPQATGSPGTDEVEAQALLALFGGAERLADAEVAEAPTAPVLPPLIGFKPWVGHGMGASTAVDLALLLSCLELGSWPATLPAHQQPEARFALRWVCAEHAAAQGARPHQVLCLGVGFGGGHGALLLQEVRT